MKHYRPGILASRATRVANAHIRSLPLQQAIKSMEGATIPEMVARLRTGGFKAARGGEVTYNTVKRAMERSGQEIPAIIRPSKPRTTKTHNVRARVERYEVFRTPLYSLTPLLDYRPEWFTGSGYDPAAGDGRMIREIIKRGNPGPHFVNDIREEEAAKLQDCGTVTNADYLRMADLPRCDFLVTNPPFTLAMEFVEKAKAHISGPICILQSIAWQATKKRSEWLRRAGLAYVLNLPRRPKWEVDTGDHVANNMRDFAWFVVLPDHTGGTVMDWLVE
jgi:hypothetical protein